LNKYERTYEHTYKRTCTYEHTYKPTMYERTYKRKYVCTYVWTYILYIQYVHIHVYVHIEYISTYVCTYIQYCVYYFLRSAEFFMDAYLSLSLICVVSQPSRIAIACYEFTTCLLLLYSVFYSIFNISVSQIYATLYYVFIFCNSTSILYCKFMFYVAYSL